MNKFIGRTIKDGTFGNGEYQCQHDWPEDCMVQCGGDGLVVSSSVEDVFADPLTAVAQVIGLAEQPQGSYRTAFFEAFPRNPNTFIRGEGKTIQDAETAAWEKHQRYLSCQHPAWEKRGYKNGLGFCVECGMSSSRKFVPWEKCPICDYPIYPDSSECYHCHLFEIETVDNEGSSSLGRFIRENRSAALWLIQQPISCESCGMGIIDMRFISDYDYRLTPDERQRQDRLYSKVFNTAMQGRRLFDRPDRRALFPASVFYECNCDNLKLITDLKWSKENG